MKDKKESKKKNILVVIIVVLIVIILCTAGYLVVKQFHLFGVDGGEEFSVPKTFSTDMGTSPTFINKQDLTMPSIAPGTEPTTMPPTTGVVATGIPRDEDPVDFESLMAMNPDVYSWIYIPDTNISYPVAQSPMDDNFYLNHDVYQDYSFPGAIYSQAMNSREYTDRVTVLYGHNMNNGSMFATLHNFSDKTFFDEHPYFYIYTTERRLTYEVVTAFEYDDRHIMNSFDFSDDAVFQDWLDQAKTPRSVYYNVRDSVNLSLDSKLVVLSTCLNYGDGRYLVQGVLVNDERTE